MSEKLGSYSFKADDTVLQHELKEMVLNNGLKTVAAEFGVSGNTISNICRGIGPQNCREYLRMNFSDYFKMPWTELTTLWTAHNAKDYEPYITVPADSAEKLYKINQEAINNLKLQLCLKEIVAQIPDDMLVEEMNRRQIESNRIDFAEAKRIAAQLLEQLSGK